MFLVTTLLEKKSSGKKSSEEKRVHISNNTHIGCLIKNLTRKTSGTKPHKEKRVQRILTSPNENILEHLHPDLVHHLLESCSWKRLGE